MVIVHTLIMKMIILSKDLHLRIGAMNPLRHRALKASNEKGDHGNGRGRLAQTESSYPLFQEDSKVGVHRQKAAFRRCCHKRVKWTGIQG